ncbi:mechanosensitive ion channel family protein [Planctomycetota bacterium]
MWELIQYWKISIWVIGLPILLGIAGHLFAYKLIQKFSQRSGNKIDDSLARHLYKPILWLVVFFVIRLGLGVMLPAVDTAGEELAGIKHLLGLIIIGLISWLFIKAVSVLEDYVSYRFDVNAKDNLQARKIHTQFRVLRRLVIIIVIIIAAGTMLMTFPRIKQLGTTILASAGIIGIVLGFAAQRTLGTFIAGLQIAFTQPIRVDDVVIVEGEWGRIEEITLTYVVVRIWDSRRLIVPITQFIEKPFQNWTRVTADILGTVYLYTDYTVPVEKIRQELERILKDSELWDGKVCGLQVTNATDKTIELRALMSAPDASIAWTLRCHVREKLIDFIKTKYPQALPKFRAQTEQPEKAVTTRSRTGTKTKKVNPKKQVNKQS